MSPEHKAKVSVILPVYNGAPYLEEALRSVLAQTHSPYEILIIDDGSTDGSAQIAKGFGSSVKYHKQPHQGQSTARNHGVQLANGDTFAFLDADDLWVQDKLHSQIIAFEQNPQLDIVSGHVQQFYSPDLEEAFRKKIHCPKGSFPVYIGGAMLIKREAFFRVGLFETNLQVGVDMSWTLRAQEAKLNMSLLPQIVLKRRLHKNNKGIVLRHLIHQRLHFVKASLDRRRSQKESMSHSQERLK